jgi:hypothetical protein
MHAISRTVISLAIVLVSTSMVSHFTRTNIEISLRLGPNLKIYDMTTIRSKRRHCYIHHQDTTSSETELFANSHPRIVYFEICHDSGTSSRDQVHIAGLRAADLKSSYQHIPTVDVAGDFSAAETSLYDERCTC